MATTPAEIMGSLRRNRRSVLGQLERILDRAIALAEDAVETAKRVAQFANPWFMTRRGKEGELVRAARQGLAKSYPGQAGMASSFARGLMEHETNVAHGHSAIIVAQRTPGVGVKWSLSVHHGISDECDVYATADSGYGPGIYDGSDVPPHPSHYRCRCQLVTVPLREQRAA